MINCLWPKNASGGMYIYAPVPPVISNIPSSVSAPSLSHLSNYTPCYTQFNYLNKYQSSCVIQNQLFWQYLHLI